MIFLLPEEQSEQTKEQSDYEKKKEQSKCDFLLKTNNSFLASRDFCRLLITFTNSLNPDQDRQNVGPDLDPNCLTLILFLKETFENIILKERSADSNKSMHNFPAFKELNNGVLMQYFTEDRLKKV